MAKMSDTELTAILAAERADSLSAMNASKLSDERSKAMDYYLGDMEKDMPAPSDRSRAVSTDVHLDRSENTFTFQRVQDVESILENNKRLQSEQQKSDWGRHIASIPNVFLEKWINEDGVNYLALPKDEFARLIKRKLRDPDYAWLRTTDKAF
jgi:hypothetical protein